MNRIIKYLNPFGIQISSSQTSANFIENISGDELRSLVKQFRFVLLRGFAAIDKQQLIHYAKSIGPLLEWEFGSVMEMRVHDKPKNYLFTNGLVPFHWDGAFHRVPRYLLFHCVEAPLKSTGGETLFSDTTLIWKTANEIEQKNWIRYSLSYKTEKLAHYGGSIIERLVQAHPDTRRAFETFSPRHLRRIQVL